MIVSDINTTTSESFTEFQSFIATIYLLDIYKSVMHNELTRRGNLLLIA